MTFKSDFSIIVVFLPPCSIYAIELVGKVSRWSCRISYILDLVGCFLVSSNLLSILRITHKLVFSC